MTYGGRLRAAGIAASLALVAGCSSDTSSGSVSTGSAASVLITANASDTVSSATSVSAGVGADGGASMTTVAAGDGQDFGPTYTVAFGGEPTVATLDPEQTGALTTSRSFDLPNGDFEAVAETDLAATATASLDAMVEGTRRAVSGGDVTVTTVSFDGWEGRQWSFSFEKSGTAGTYYAVGAVVDQQLVQVAYVDIGSDDAADAAAFLASFQVVTPGPH